MGSFIFDLQRFADVTIAAGETYALDGVTYTAVTDAQLNLADGKVSGIASGKVQAVADGVENSPVVTFDGTTTPFDFTCTKNSNALNVSYNKSSLDYTSGNVTYSGSGVTFQSGTVGLAGKIAKMIPYSVNLDVPTAGLSATFDGDNFNLKSPDTVTATLNLPAGLSTLLKTLKSVLPKLLKVSEPTFEKLYDIAQKLLTTETSIKLSGEATYNKATKTLSFAQDSSADINALGYEVNLKAVDGALDGISVYYQKDGDDISAGVKIAADSGDGKLKLNVLKNGVTLFNDVLKISNGTMTFDPINAKVSVDADTSLSMTVRDIYTANMTALNALSTTFSADEEGNIVLTPENFSVKATLQRDDATIFDGEVSLEKGSLFFNQESHSINVTSGTKLTFKQATHSVSLTATDDAGIKIVAENDGNFTITPGEDDGSLNFALSKGDTLVLGGNLSLSNGSLVFNPAKQEISFTKGTTSVITVGDRSISLTATDTATAKIKIDADGNFIFTPDENGSALDFSLSELTQNGTNLLMKKAKSSDIDNDQDDNNILNGNVAVSGGSLGFNLAKQELSLTKDTKTAFTLGNYTFDFTATDDISSKFAIDADGNFIFTPGENDGSLNVVLKKGDTAIFGGNLAVSNGSIGFNPATQELSFTKGTKTAFTLGNYTFDFTATDDISSKFAVDADGNFIFTPGENDGSLNVVFKKGDTAIFGGNLAVSDGSIGFNPATQELSFTKDTKTALTLGNYTFELTATDDISSKFAIDADGNFIFTPGENDGSLNVVFKKGDTPIFNNIVSVVGEISFNPTTQSIGLADGTKISAAFGDYEVTATADGDATVSVAMTSAGLSITPVKGDGTLNLQLGTESGSMSANLEVLSGSFILGENGALTIAKDTELQIDFGGGYVVKFKTTDDAGGSISLGTDGLTFTPTEGDGHLELSVTRDGETRTATLEMTGSLTYKLDGSISLAKDTVVKNVFEDGNILTITANTDASGSILFHPQNGITITPAEAEALNVLFSGDGGEVKVFDITSIDGSVTYKGGVITASDGSEVRFTNYYMDSEMKLRTDGGSSSLEITEDSTSYIANEGATFVLDYLDGDTLEISDGKFIDDYEHAIVTAGATFKTNDEEDYFYLQTAGNYTLNGISVTTTKDNVPVLLSDYNTVKFGEDIQTNLATSISGNDLTVTASAKEGQGSVTVDDDGNITYDATDCTLKISVPLEDVIGDSLLPGDFTISGGSITMGATDADGLKSISVTKGTALSFTKNGMTFDTVVQNDINGRLWMRDGHVIYLHTYEEAPFDTTITFADKGIFKGMITLGGAFAYNAATGSTGPVDSNTYNVHDSYIQVALGNQTLKLTINDDTFFAILDVDDDGKITFDFNNENYNSMLLNISTGDTDILNGTLAVKGTIDIDPAAQEFSLVKDTVLTFVREDGKTLEITALDDAGGQLTLTEAGIRFAPNENDGALELNFLPANRKADLNITGAVIFGNDGKLSLEDGTEVNLTWEDGNSLKLTSSGSTGSIGFDDKGLVITSEDENLNMTFTSSAMSTDISGIKGTIHYNAGNVLFDENSKITATTTLGGQPMLTTLEAIDGTGHISFNTTNGVLYAADTGAMKITWSRDDLESTFVVNKGSVQIGHNLFSITEGSDIATDLKTFVPALYFTTTEAGTYTINGQTIKTSAEGLALTATDDQMIFKTSGDVVEYDGMTFTGAGNVSLKADNVVLGAGVEATGFGEGNSFVLAEAGNVTADAKVFELTKLDTEIEIPMEISVTGAQDGFTFSRTLTKESEAYLDDALNEKDFGNYSSSYIGKVFSEKFIAAGDSSYRIRTDAIGLEEVIGISDGATITGGASLGEAPTLSYYKLITDTEGKFTIGEKTYSVSGDSSIAITARFEESAAPYASAVESLSGTINGDFSGGNFSINGSSALKIIGDSAIDIVADKNGYEILGLDAGASLQVSKADTYKINGTEIAAGASAVIVGTPDNKASLYTLPAALADFMLHETEAGYPQMAALAFHPDEENPDAPTNYHSVENWTADSTDNLKLSAIHYSPENPTGKWVILVHGYGKKGAAMNAFAEPYLAQGLDVLIVDQRTAGDSEGDWLTMGVAEANDLAIWTQEIAKTNANAQITLHGVSMGAATVMLCAALPETANLSAIIEDCGYGNIADVFAALLSYYGPSLGVSGDVDFYKLFDEVAEVAKIFDGGYDVSDAVPIDSIAAVTVPSLFIHGAADAVIPSINADALYEKSGATNKTKLIVEGAGHAKSVELDTETYLAAVKKLIDSSTKEIGALINSDADNKLLRGTVYNDTITNSGTTVTIEALGGDDYIANNVDSSLVAASLGNSINAGDGNDTIYSYHTYNPTLLGGAGDDSIVVERGHKNYIEGGAGNDTIIGVSQEGGWGMGDYSTVLGGEGDDYINPIYSANASIDGGEGNDTILANGASATVDGGTGKNLIVMTDEEGGVTGKFVVLNGNTTVESFNTGFGEGTDTVYITGESPAVDFKADGLTLYYDDDKTKSLTFSDIKKTAKLNLYYEQSLKAVAEVFIADDEWYSVTEDDLFVMNDSELFFVGATAKMNHGIDFSGITDDVNATLLGHNYPDYVENLWINNIHSIKGGAGNTTITGSDKSDTILAGKGATTINAAQGDDFISLDSASALIEYTAGDGNDSIQGFRADSTLNISGAAYTSIKSGDNLIFTVGDDKITLQDAANLDKLNIIGKTVAEEVIVNVVGNYPEDEIISLNDSTSQDIDLTQKDYDVAVVESGATGNKNISLGGGDLVVVEDAGANVNITASKGNDTVFSQSENISVSLRGGKTDFITTSGKMKIAGYDSSTDSGFHTEYEDILAAINDGKIYFDKGKLSIDSAVIDFNGLNSGVINFFNADGELQKFGQAAPDESLDLSNEKANFILVADKYSTLTGSKGNDTLFAFAGSLVDASAGKNFIYIEERDENADGATIALTTGRNTIVNFTAGFDDTSDRLFFGVNDTVDFKFDGTDLKAYNNGELRGIVSGVADNAPFVNIWAEDDNAPVKIVVAQEEAIVTVDGELADLYSGEKSGVDFTNYEGDLMINLGSTEESIGGGEVLFSGINQITVGGSLNTLIGSSANETLTGNEDGTTEFVFDENSGRDLIKNFNFAEDKINVGNETITAVVLKESNVRLQIDGDDWLTLEDAQGKNFQINEFTAKVDKNIEYDDAANYFVATGNKATLTVGEDVEDDAIIWLNNPERNGSCFIGNILTLDASNSTVKTELAGNDLDNTILAGSGDASLWGGNGGNDLLVGGTGQNMFFYAYGNGNDTINGTNSGDVVYLAGITFNQIASTEIAQGTVAINFTDGGRLNVAGSNAVEFVLEGETYLADHSTGTWQKK